MRARWTVLAVLALGAVLVALPAIAQEELNPADRALLHSYSPESMQLFWATWLDDDTDAEDCEVEEGASYTYEVSESGVSLTSDEEDVVTDGCAITATDVRGPNGQVNHGTVVSNFVHALREAGYEGGVGCYVRAIAHTDYGKGDQQIRTSEVEEPDEGSLEEAPEIEFTITEADCGKPDSPEEGSDEAGPAARGNKGKGKPDWAGTPGPPPHAKGRGR